MTTTRTTQTTSSHITNFFRNLLAILSSCFRHFRVKSHPPNNDLSQNNMPNNAWQPTTTLENHVIKQATITKPMIKQPNNRTIRQTVTTRPIITQPNERTIKQTATTEPVITQPNKRTIRPVTPQSTVRSTRKHKKTLTDNQHQWSETLWHIHHCRLKDKSKPVKELRKHHKKKSCWSWQWFPAGYEKYSSKARKACAFKNEQDLMTYYHSSILMNGFLELANEAVKYPMMNPADEQVLEKSLLLCQYAAQKSEDTQMVLHLDRLIKQQMTKEDQSMRGSRRAVARWLNNYCQPISH